MKKKVNLKAEQIDNQSKIAEFVKAIEENKILNAKIRINKALLEDAKALLDLHDSIEGDNLNITMTSSIVAEHIVTEHTRKNKLYFADGTKSFFQDKEYHIYSLSNKDFLITACQPWGMDKTIYTIKSIIKKKIDTTLKCYDTLAECSAFIEGYTKHRYPL
jgi:metal-dependent hydrolase (beta-lactamase superfamily II)